MYGKLPDMSSAPGRKHGPREADARTAKLRIKSESNTREKGLKRAAAGYCPAQTMRAIQATSLMVKLRSG